MHAVMTVLFSIGWGLATVPVAAESSTPPVTIWHFKTAQAILFGQSETLYFHLAYEPENSVMAMVRPYPERPETCNIRSRTDRLEDESESLSLFGGARRHIETVIFTNASCPDLSVAGIDVVRLELRHSRVRENVPHSRFPIYEYTAHLKQTPEHIHRELLKTPQFEDGGCQRAEGKIASCRVSLPAIDNQPAQSFEFKAGVLPGSGTVIEG